MAGRPLKKVQCESFTRGSKFTIQCRCKGYYQKSSKKYRCKFHGGMSTGARTLEGKIKAYKNLRFLKNKTDDEIKQWILDRLKP